MGQGENLLVRLVAGMSPEQARELSKQPMAMPAHGREGFDWAGECDRQAGMVHELSRRAGYARAEIRGAMLHAIDQPAVMAALRRALAGLEGDGRAW